MFFLMCSHILNLQIHAESYTFLDPNKTSHTAVCIKTHHTIFFPPVSIYMQITLCHFHKCYTCIYRLYLYNIGGPKI